MNKKETTTLICSGNLEIKAGYETIIPVKDGCGPWCVKNYRALRIIRKFIDDLGMDRCEVEVEPA